MSEARVRFLLAVLLVAVAPFYFHNLGDPLIWQDEGTTALHGYHILETGLPMVGEGPDSASQVVGTARGAWGVNVDIPWLQDYMAAAGLLLRGGASRPRSVEEAHVVTRWLRFPFALTGWLIPLATYAMVLAGLGVGVRAGDGPASRATENRARWIGLVAAVLTVTAPLLILHSRQCRYYAPVTFLVVATLLTYLRLGQGRRPARVIGYALSNSLLLLANDAVWVGVTLAIIVHWVFRTAPELQMTRILRAHAAPATLAAAWFLLVSTAPDRYFRVNPAVILSNLAAYATEINAHVLPGIVVAVGAGVRWSLWVRRRGPERKSGVGVTVFRDSLWQVIQAPGARFGFLLGLVALSVVGSHAALDMPSLRYLVPTIPLAAAAMALWLVPRSASRTALVVAILVVAISAGSDALGWVSDYPLRDSPIERAGRRHAYWVYPHTQFDLLERLSSPPDGPVEAALNVMFSQGSEGDVAVVTYGDQSLKVLSPLQVYGGFTGEYPAQDTQPDWIWLRAFNRVDMEGRRGVTARWIEDNIDLSRYETIPLGVGDRPWETRPDIDVFWVLEEANPFFWIYDDGPVPEARILRRRELSD